MRVVRVYHSGRSRGHRARERALVAAGHELTLVVPANWTESGAEAELSAEPFEIVELAVSRADDINRHQYQDSDALRQVILDRRPEVVDIHEEPYSAVSRQVLGLLPAEQRAVMYTAQNVDKRYPPPFSRYERAAYGRVSAMYPCSRLAASVARGRGFGGIIRVLPLGFDDALFVPGSQEHDDEVFQVCLVGRLVPEKGLFDALRAFKAILDVRPSRFVLAGSGPLEGQVTSWIEELGLQSSVERVPWLPPEDVALLYRRSHLTLVPSLATSRIVEQFGRMVVEAQASGTPVIAYATGALPEVAEGAAVLLDQGDWRGLAAAAATLAAEPGVWQGYRDEGFRVAPSKSWKSVAKGQGMLYDLAAGAVPVPARSRQRLLAEAEFGRTAELSGRVRRPFALPVLRDLPVLARSVDRVSNSPRR